MSQFQNETDIIILLYKIQLFNDPTIIQLFN